MWVTFTTSITPHISHLTFSNQCQRIRKTHLLTGLSSIWRLYILLARLLAHIVHNGNILNPWYYFHLKEPACLLYVCPNSFDNVQTQQHVLIMQDTRVSFSILSWDINAAYLNLHMWGPDGVGYHAFNLWVLPPHIKCLTLFCNSSYISNI